MTPDLFSVPIVLDTSVLHSTSASSAPFQVLKGLAETGLVRVFVPELAAEEFRTQWRDKNQSNISQGVKALKALSSEALLPASVTTGAGHLSDQLSLVDLESLSNDFLTKYMKDNGFEILPLSFDQAKGAWKSYFVGNLPSKKVKHRPDIPDAHIVAALEELVANESNVLFASLDKGQREAASEVTGVICFDSLETVVKSAQLQPLLAKWQAGQKWKAVQNTLSFDEVTERVRGFVQANGGELLSWEEISDQSIPEDNHTASITMYGEADEVQIDGPEDWGGGLLRYRATYFSECLLSFQVFRGDAFDVPDWVSVSIGDFEKDHYFDAEGYAVVIAKVDVTVRIKLDDDVQDIDDRLEDISFESGSLELELGNYE
jgi:hypothetical protein